MNASIITTFEHLEQGSDEWLEARRGIITASVIGKLITPTLKTANNDTSRGIINTLAAERITGHVEHVHPSFDMMRGTEDEPYARDAYSEYMGVTVQEIGFMRLDGDGYTLGFSPDGLVGDDGLIEVKSRKPHLQVATILDGTIPPANLAQLHAGLLVSGRKWVDYISFAQGLPLWVKRVYPDPAWTEAIEAAARSFETQVGEVITGYRAKSAGLPVMERRPELDEIRI